MQYELSFQLLRLGFVPLLLFFFDFSKLFLQEILDQIYSV